MADLSKLDQNMLTCRDLGHAWIAISAAYVRRVESLLFERVMYCTRCDTQRTEYINDEGVTVKRRYRYPIDYLPLFPVSRRQARLYNLRKALAVLKKKRSTT